MSQEDSSLLRQNNNAGYDFDFDLSTASLDDLLGIDLDSALIKLPDKSSVAVPKLPILGGGNSSGRRYNQETWLAYRPLIQDLYITQGRPLRETRQILEEGYGFKASEKQLKARLKKWGMTKNKKAEGGDPVQNQGHSELGDNIEGNNEGSGNDGFLGASEDIGVATSSTDYATIGTLGLAR